jgi:hypothetical protein
MKKFLIIPLVMLVGCAGIDRTNDWLNSPATSQPTSQPVVTNQQVIEQVVNRLPSPYGEVLTLGVVAAGFVLHNLDSRRRQKKLVDTLSK